MGEDQVPGRCRAHALRNVSRHERNAHLNSNREIPPLEPLLSHRKQRTAPGSNSEFFALFHFELLRLARLCSHPDILPCSGPGIDANRREPFNRMLTKQPKRLFLVDAM